MCGIAGLIAKKNISEQVYEQFLQASSLMHHRGPDYNKSFRYKNVLLIHYRLSIIDLDPRSHQPFSSHNQNLVTVFNGEIYNFLDLKKKYSLQTHTTSDTEVMLESFSQYGNEAVADWNGIFAMAILDKQKDTLHLIRDRFGVKPLYIYENEEVLLFASEAKVIFDWLPAMKINYDGLAQYMWYGNTISSHSIIQGVRKAAPASITSIDINKGVINTETVFWKNPGTKKQSYNINGIVDDVKILLDAAVKRQLISDVPLGVLLSGGVDSSAIVAMGSKYMDTKLDTYSVAYDFNIGGESELPRAAMIAKKYQTNHHELHIKAKNIKDTFAALVYQFDEPFADAANIPLYELAKACSTDKKVILQGDGGDEFFGGYRRYNVLDSLKFWQQASYLGHKLIPNKAWAGRMKRMSFLLNQKNDAMRMAYYLTQDVPEKSPYTILNSGAINKLELLNPFQAYYDVNNRYRDEPLVQRMLYADVAILLPNTYLEKVDKATMLCSLEARVPFLDNELTNYILQVPSKYKVRNGEKKYLLKQALKGLVPDEILYGKKRGFDVPYKQWLKTDLYDFARVTISSFPEDGLLDTKKLLHILELHKNGTGNYGPLLWKSLVLATWLSIYKSKLVY